MNIFTRILNKAFEPTVRLGNPLGVDSGPFLARMNTMSELRGGKGFRTPKTEPRTDSDGRTRGDRKRARRADLFQS
ncbi:hypothetical protein [Manganibacter manganicus]|uniref:Uncharacterized protein n=1 Tax=Manganibacter manganicus TaxID=1873176 RepID=A0A1V8RP67_9HYPH|nr:hypothetical protein [Pseudaminobacter manganicus]OQM74923.1 hypothetical protein BFN67_04730 [Pseudaminobacter manganicus]